MKKELGFQKGRGQGRDEEVGCRLHGEVYFALGKDGGAAIVLRDLRNGAQGKIVGGEIARVYGDTLAQDIHFTALGRCFAKGFGQKKSDRQGVFGDKFHQDIVGEGDVGEAFEGIDCTEIHAA